MSNASKGEPIVTLVSTIEFARRAVDTVHSLYEFNYTEPMPRDVRTSVVAKVTRAGAVKGGGHERRLQLP
jgi:hypothetical protein